MITVTAGILMQQGRVLICQRKRDGVFPLKWEFPGGKVEPGEDFQTCLARELREELAIEAEIGPEICRLHYTYPNGVAVHLVFFRVMSHTGELANHAFAQVRWVEPSQLTDFDFLEADRDLVAELARGEFLR